VALVVLGGVLVHNVLMRIVIISFMLMIMCFEKCCSDNIYVDSRCGSVKAVFVL
jgi:hypothetical protein